MERIVDTGEPRVIDVDLGPVVATVALDAGPRILGYARPGRPQLFARLPGDVIAHPAIGTFAFLGGHRLWRAPEVPAITYQPDDRPVAVDQRRDVVTVTGPPDGDGIVKTISLHQHGQVTVVDHSLRHDGERPIRCSPWAITQLAPGGVAVLPQSPAPVDADGVLPDRSITLWPYTDPAAPEIEFRATDIMISASSRPAKTKLGQENRAGWLAYLLGDELFVKWAPLHEPGVDYPDRGSSVECYRDHRFLELETLGPLTDLVPGGEIHHQEVWSVTGLAAVPLGDVLAALPRDPLEGGT